MGVDSGLPDFRGNEGFWRAYPALGRAGLDFTEIANPRAFAQEPELAWGFYGHRLQLYRDTLPHAGFALLKAWGERLPGGAAVFTSNVDGQFQAAGFDTVHECHGSIHWLQCLNGCGRPPEPADALRPDIDEATCRWRGVLPRCACGALLRPNILMFGDGGWDGSRYEAQAVRLQSWLRRCERPLVVELGAGTAIPSVRRFGEAVVLEGGGRLLRINPREAALPRSLGLSLPMGALAALRGIEAALQRDDQRGG
ncbi:MAG: hypothetical protein J0L58_11080 [Burkholderiales bacterium]|nr:hypothetical protein [Burkholderiales bacterium]